jgi:hypothetical protein
MSTADDYVESMELLWEWKGVTLAMKVRMVLENMEWLRRELRNSQCNERAMMRVLEAENLARRFHHEQEARQAAGATSEEQKRTSAEDFND